MSRLRITPWENSQRTVDDLYADMERRISAAPCGNCPVELTSAFLKLCLAQSCGKCVPCRIGLDRLAALLDQLLDGQGSQADLDTILRTAQSIVDSADCAIGFEAAQMVLDGYVAFQDDYLAHVTQGSCTANFKSVPCVELCPAHVDVPGYISLVGEERYDDAIRLIRKDNPFPSVCGLVCEHPCETHCRRTIVDSPLNIRGIKRFAVDHAGEVPAPPRAPSSGKTVAIVGGGPSGLTAAYFLSLMGHTVTVFERKPKLGGMLRYGIPSYRFPRELLDREIDSILSLGITVITEVDVGKDIPFEELRRQYDSVYISIGAHTDKKTGIPGEDSQGVVSAVEMLRAIGDNEMPDFTGKKVVVIGGGNVAMDVTRSSVRLGADKVSCVYRRRQVDMTALPEEVEGAVAEGVELLTLMAPVRIEADENGHAVALWVQPQMPGDIRGGRPAPKTADQPEVRIPADVVVFAIGQGIETNAFEHAGIPIHRGTIDALSDSKLAKADMDGIFAGGDCVTGPASAIKAIAAGKVAAANIDEYLGFRHEITVDVTIPDPDLRDRTPHGRVNTTEREASERKHDFVCIECGLSQQGALEESARCLRCDHFGYGAFKGGRHEKW